MPGVNEKTRNNDIHTKMCVDYSYSRANLK